jgi:hypothetical protein
MVMAMSDPDSDKLVLATAVRRELLRIARREDDLAATTAASVPYWAPNPPSVLGHRAAAAALRSEADRLLPAS